MGNHFNLQYCQVGKKKEKYRGVKVAQVAWETILTYSTARWKKKEKKLKEEKQTKKNTGGKAAHGQVAWEPS